MPHSDNGGTLAREAWELIPWVANGRASREERARVEAHVQDCQDCADELAFQRRLQGEIARDTEPVGTPEAPLRELMQRIDADDPTPLPQGRLRVAGQRRWQALLVPGLVSAVVLEAAALALLVGLTWLRLPGARPGAGFRTLTAEAPAARPGTLRVVFAADMQMDQIQRLLAPLHLQIVGGPTAVGAVTLASDGMSRLSTSAALAALRRHPGVRFAEPLDSPSP